MQPTYTMQRNTAVLAKRNIWVRYALVILHTLFVSNAVIYCFKQNILPIQPSLLVSALNLITIIAAYPRLRTNDPYLRVFRMLFKPYCFFAAFYILCFLAGHVYMQEGIAEVFLPVLSLFTVFAIAMQYSTGLITQADIRLVLWLSFLLLVITAAIDFVHPGTFSKLETRSAGLGENPNSTGFRVIILLFFITCITKSKHLLTAAIALTIGTVAITLSRGGIFLLCVFVLLKLFKWRQDKLFRSLIIRLGIAGIVAALVFSPQSVFKRVTNQTTLNRITMIMNSGETIESDSRVSLAKAYYNLSLDRPVFGYGLLKSKDTSVFDLGPHNTYLMVFYETGILGLILLLCFLVNNINFYIRYRYYPGVLCWALISLELFFSHNLIYEYFFSFSTAYLIIFFMEEKYVKH